ncbi:MAG: hypothetical protein M3076_12070 [Actinomycetota bacterium]|nr:hypothetical protein [Actinomycetota bacterium]
MRRDPALGERFEHETAARRIAPRAAETAVSKPGSLSSSAVSTCQDRAHPPRPEGLSALHKGDRAGIAGQKCDSQV